MGRGTCFNEEREEGHSARCVRQVYTSLAAVQRRLDAETSTVLVGVVIFGSEISIASDRAAR